VFRHFPLYDVHPFALTAALAAEAAGAFGKFWEMHDLLFAHQDMLADYKLKYYAERVGVDGDLVVGDAAQRYGDAVEFDYAQGVELGVRGTPTLFVNGVAYRDRVELSALRKATTSRRARAQADTGGGTGSEAGAESDSAAGRGLLQKLRLAPGSRR
nr:thioredoxin domain-containing protein [Micromonospora sp. DSM 115978]